MDISWKNQYSVEELIKLTSELGIEIVDLKFCDLLGKMYHLSIPATRFEQSLFKRGIGIDGSNCPGFTRLESGDVNILPDPATAYIDEFYEFPALSFLCDIVEADTGEPFSRDPRGVAKRAEQYLSQTGIADESWWLPELEFYVFDDIYYSDKPYDTGYGVDSSEADWNSVEEEVLHWQRHKRGYHSVAPEDKLHDLRAEITLTLEDMGIPVRYFHHEVGGAGQCEIELLIRSGVVRTADTIIVAKHVIRNIASELGQTVTFMPKPIYGEPGTGMHFHQKLHLQGKNIFFSENGYAGLSDSALHYIAGLSTHARPIMAFTNPSTNSYRRMVKGFEAPTRVFFSLANRSAAIRIPKSAVTEDKKRIEFRMPDGTANPYLAVSSMLLAGLDGIKNKLDWKKFGPLDKNLHHLSQQEQEKYPAIPESLESALKSLEQNSEFLKTGEVFDDDLIKTWIDMKMEREVDPIHRRPHPFEIELYFNL
jgi:glutamine synthetase